MSKLNSNTYADEEQDQEEEPDAHINQQNILVLNSTYLGMKIQGVDEFDAANDTKVSKHKIFNYIFLLELKCFLYYSVQTKTSGDIIT